MSRRSALRRGDRLEVRLSWKAKSVLKRAADARGQTVGAFLLEQALQAAADTLAERTLFPLSVTQFDSLSAELDAPSRPRARLEKLLTSSSVLE